MINLLESFKSLLNTHHKKFKFITIGIFCFLINEVVLYVLVHANWSVALAQIIGYEAGLLFGFYANSRWTYNNNKRGSTKSSLLKYHWASLSGLVLSTLIVVLLTSHHNIHPNLALVFASAVVMVSNYLLFDRFVFAEKSALLGLGKKTPRAQLIKIALLVFLIWEIIITAVGIWATGLGTIAQPQIPAHTPYVLEHTMRWDATWYHGISDESWYKTHVNAPAFYPLFPAILHSISYILNGGNTVVIGFIFNAFATALAFCLLTLIVYEFTRSKRLAIMALLLFASFPAAFFMHAFYTEALFCALGFAAFYSALRRQWLITCLLLGALTASRLPSIFFVLACFLEYLRSIQYNYKNLKPDILYFLLTPIGFIVYALYLNNLYGSPLYMFTAYHVGGAWSYQVFSLNIFNTVVDTLHNSISVARHRPDGWTFYLLWQTPSLIAWLAAMALLAFGAIKRYISLPMLALAICSCIFFVLNSNFVSVIRYLLPIFPLYIILSKLLVKSSYVFALVISALFLVELWFYVLFVMDFFIA